MDKIANTFKNMWCYSVMHVVLDYYDISYDTNHSGSETGKFGGTLKMLLGYHRGLELNEKRLALYISKTRIAKLLNLSCT